MEYPIIITRLQSPDVMRDADPSPFIPEAHCHAGAEDGRDLLWRAEHQHLPSEQVVVLGVVAHISGAPAVGNGTHGVLLVLLIV